MGGAKLSGWTKEQKSVVVAAYLGWALDGFDLTLMVFLLRDIAREFNTEIPAVAFALVLTLALRPIGAFIFGRVADHYGRRPALMASILAYSVMTFACGFATDLTMLLVLRGLFGVAMGGEWGVGASLAMETIPAKARGFVSGVLQTGTPSGYLLASIAYGLLFEHIGWRGMFMIGILPALLVLYVRAHTKESPKWRPRQVSVVDTTPELIAYGRLLLYALAIWAGFALYAIHPTVAVVCTGVPLIVAMQLASRDAKLWIEVFIVFAMLAVDFLANVGFVPELMAMIYNLAAILAGVFLKSHWRVGIYAVLLMTALNFFAHGTQDLYPTFLQVQRGFSPPVVGTLMVIFNIGAIAGSVTFGALSERIGRRRTVVIAALLSLPVAPFFAFGELALFLAPAVFLMEFMVQGSWAVVPAYLNELSPAKIRGTFPGFVYQLGNLFASVNAALQADYATEHGNDYATALAIVPVSFGIVVALLVAFGIERKGVHLGTDDDDQASLAYPDTKAAYANRT